MKRWCGPSARLRTIGFGSLSSKPQKAREQEPEVCAPRQGCIGPTDVAVDVNQPMPFASEVMLKIIRNFFQIEGDTPCCEG